MRGATSSPFYALIVLQMVEGENTEHEEIPSRGTFSFYCSRELARTPSFFSGVENKFGNTNFCPIGNEPRPS